MSRSDYSVYSHHRLPENTILSSEADLVVSVHYPRMMPHDGVWIRHLSRSPRLPPKGMEEGLRARRSVQPPCHASIDSDVTWLHA